MAPTGTSTSLSHSSSSSSSSSSASDNNNNLSRWSRRRRTPFPSEMTAANIGILLLLALFANFGTISNAELIPSHVFNNGNGQSRGLRLLDDAAREADQRPSPPSSPLSVQLLDSDENNKPLDDGGYNLVEPADTVSDEAAAFEEGEEDRSVPPEDLPSLEFVQHHSVFINGGADGTVEAKDEQDMLVVPMLMEPKRKKSVRRCGTVLLKHIQTVCGGCLRSPNPGGEVMLMSKRGSGESPLDVRNRLKRQAPGFNKITDICCTQRACGDEEVKPFCC